MVKTEEKVEAKEQVVVMGHMIEEKKGENTIGNVDLEGHFLGLKGEAKMEQGLEKPVAALAGWVLSGPNDPPYHWNNWTQAFPRRRVECQW